jgi:hypothetical protein
MPASHKNGIALSAIAAVNGIAKAAIAAINGVTVPAGGGGGPTFVDADQGVAGSVSSVSTDANINPSGTNRYAVAALLTLDFGSVTHDDVDLGSTSFDEIDTTNEDGSGFYRRSSTWQAVAPATGAQAASGTLSASAFRAAIAMAVYSGVNQATPRGSMVANTGTYDGTTGGTASVQVTGAVSGDRIVAFVYLKDESASPRALGGSGTVRAQLASPDAEQVGIVEFTAGGSDPTVSVSISTGTGEGGSWLIRAFKLNGA